MGSKVIKPPGGNIMQITIDLPDHLHLTEANLRTELAIALFQQERITLGTMSVTPHP
ncbi:UPF0175 family protein [Leptolyngbya sp. 'hensonii']|uniref:UPF0175 family protein n=1 Tax=Leptolyngbya sp. 'hensonii' TaxID=1922337 RepID=UPI001C0C62F4|nr:UPF0175 family protein [Leptolyngbya sp. 'hensonii']